MWTTVTCPVCGHANIPGTDSCEKCESSLTQEERSTAEQSIITGPIDQLQPRPPICVPPHSSVAAAITQMKEGNMGCLLVTDEAGCLVGIFTERDVLYKVAGLQEDLNQVTVEQLMTPRPTALKKSLPIAHALHLMALHGFRHIPLVDNQGHPEGIISFRAVVRFIRENFSLPDPRG